MENKTLTDEIYAELVDGLKTGSLDWTHFLAKHSTSKGPLYNAIGRFFSDIEPRVRSLNEVQEKLDQAGLRLNQLNQNTKEADKTIEAKNHDIVALEEKENTLRKQIESLESDVEQKDKLLNRLQELEKLDFGEERLKALHTILVEVGTKRGLKRGEAVNVFFAELKDYDAIQGFSQELQRLDAIIVTKSLEAKKWKVEAESLERDYRELGENISAVQSLAKQGVKPHEIVSWNKCLSTVGGVAELEQGLEKYKSIQGLQLNKRKEIRVLERDKAKLDGELKELRQEKAQIEGAIKATTEAGIKEIDKVAQVAAKRLKEIASQAEGEVSSYISQFDQVVQKAYEVGARVGECKEQLGEYEKVKEVIVSHEALEEER